MFSGGSRQIAPEYFVKDNQLTIRPYNRALNDLTSKICDQIGLRESTTCMFETRVAFDCVLRRKVSKFGDITDNLGACSHHINNMKTNLAGESPKNEQFIKVIDTHLDEIQNMRKSFV